MKAKANAQLLRIYISSTDKFEHKPLYEVIVYAAKQHEIAGATVIKGVMGYGASSQIYSQKLWEVSEKIPIIIEIIDETAKIEKFVDLIIPFFEKSGKGCMVTLQEANILLKKIGGKRS